MTWAYALIGCGASERVFARLGEAVYVASPNDPNPAWVDHKLIVPAYAEFYAESDSPTILTPKQAVEFVMEKEGF